MKQRLRLHARGAKSEIIQEGNEEVLEEFVPVKVLVSRILNIFMVFILMFFANNNAKLCRRRFLNNIIIILNNIIVDLSY